MDSIWVSHASDKFLPVGAEEFDAVVFERIVRSRNHHAHIGAKRTREHRHGGRRQRPQQEHIHADRREARHQCGFDHIAGKPRILADHNAMAMIAAREEAACGHASLHREFGRQCRRIRAPANAVGSEKCTCHVRLSPAIHTTQCAYGIFKTYARFLRR